MKKKLFRFGSLLLCVVLAVAITACSAPAPAPAPSAGSGGDTGTPAAQTPQDAESPAAPQGGVTLTIMGNSDDIARPYMQAAFKNYEEKTGNKLDIQGIPSDSFEQVALTKFTTGDIPDIFMHFGGYTLKAYNPDENFYDFKDAPWVNDIMDNVKSQTVFNGRVVGLPHWEASISGTIYNKKIFDDLGIAIPTTQQEFVDACQKILDAGITPVYFAFKDVWPFMYQFPLDTIFENEETLKAINSNQIKYADIPEIRKVVEWYKMMADKGYLGDMYTTNTYDYTADALVNGEYAMTILWDTWLYTDLEVKYPGEAVNYGLMPAFMGVPEEGTFEGPNVSLLMVNKNGEKVNEAVDFVNFMADPENYNIAFDGISTAPVFKGQTTNLTTPQYTESKEIIDKVGRPSITWAQVIGFSQTEGAKYIQDLMIGNIGVDECIAGMDQKRIESAKAQQAEGF